MVAFGLAFAMVAGSALAERAAALKSGPQAGEELAGPFHPLNCNGKAAGKKHCLYCENGQAPVAMIFAREPSANLTKLIKKLDEACVKNKSARMASFVVFLSDEEGLGTKLKKIAKDEDLKKVILSIDNPAGPKGYKVNKDADITVVLYVERTAKANYAFRKNGLTSEAIGTIMKGLPKILTN
jgi:type IV secretory pathway VirJ component